MTTLQHPLEYYIRGLGLPLQKALLARVDAINEPDMIKSLRLFAIAREYLHAAAETDPNAMYLLIDSYKYAGWGANCSHTYEHPTHPEYLRLERMWLYTAYYDAGMRADAIKEALHGNPIPIYAFGASGPPLENDLANALYALGLYYNSHANIAGLHNSTLLNYACMSVSNLVRVFRLCKIVKSPDLPWHCHAMISQRYKIGWLNEDSKYVLKYIIGYCATVYELDPKCVKEINEFISILICKKYYRKRQANYRSAAVTWMLCARGFVCRDVARIIGQYVYAGRICDWAFQKAPI